MRILITGGHGNIATMIRKNLETKYEIVALGRADLDILSYQDLKDYFKDNHYDILVHTAILGGRRTKEETGEVTHKNLLMLENLLRFADQFQMIINFDSAAIYDRCTDILNRSEDELWTVPSDYYGFSKYVIYQRSLQYSHFYNFRIFNIFHANEESDRFIKSCFTAKNKNLTIPIFEDKYFDFVYEDDFIKIIDYYFQNRDNQRHLDKTLNVCYPQKNRLSEIALMILGDKSRIIIEKSDSVSNYSGDGTKLAKLDLNLVGLENSLKIYESLLKIN
jgi:nucleoside-diphosphate-sugar epimerase